MKKQCVILITTLITSFCYGQNYIEKLEKISSKLSEIKAISFNLISSSSAPYDTVVFETNKYFYQIYIDTTDKYFGAKFYFSDINNHNLIHTIYDGRYRVILDHDNKTASIDTFTGNRKIHALLPFYIRLKILIDYTKQNIDKAVVYYYDFKDSIKIKIIFNDRYIEFVGKDPIIRENKGDKSIYEIFTDKNFMPYKLIKRMNHQTIWETCTDINLSKKLNFEFNAIKKIPPEYSIDKNEKFVPKAYELEGKLAPAWKLKQIGGDSISLDELNHKIILLQFSSIGCGPCHFSIPFMRKLKTDFNNKDIDIICIETHSKNINGIKRYSENNQINYKHLVSENEINKKYLVEMVPTFYLLDEKRIIKKVIVGYMKDKTDKEIIDLINELLTNNSSN